MPYRYYYDTEFLENGRTIDLISIGIVNEEGESYYAVNAEVGESVEDGSLGKRIAASDWLMKNVVPHLPLYGDVKRYNGVPSNRWMPPPLDMKSTTVRPAWVIANEVREFLAEGGDDIELWANWGAYDHVALMQLYGPMIRRPEHIPMYTNDIQQAARMVGGLEHLPAQEGTEHDALADALHVKHCYDVLAPYMDYGRAA
jgi:hypothetical protein